MWKLITLIVLLSLEIAFAGGELLCSIFHHKMFPLLKWIISYIIYIEKLNNCFYFFF